MQKKSTDFTFGIATSSYHYEGGNYNSDWRRFEESYFRKDLDQQCGIGIDYWNRWKEDHDYLSELGVKAFRTSVEWSRIEPRPGEFDEAVLDQYKEMFKDLKKRGIKVTLTLFHYSAPIWFSQLDGFNKRNNLHYFDRFAKKTLEHLHEYIEIVTPINEILVYTALGYLTAYWPPQKHSLIHCLITTRNLIRAHFLVAEEIHRKKYDIKVSTAEQTRSFQLIHDSNLFEWPAKFLNYLFNKAVTKSILHNRFAFPFGSWGKVTRKAYKEIDFIGIQFYPVVKANVIFDKFLPKLVPYKFNGTWAEVFLTAKLRPRDLFLTLREYNKLGKPILITESGIQSSVDKVRSSKLTANIQVIKKARAKGINIQGYYYFTLFDCFEWAEGYTKKYGLISVDRKNGLERTKKQSFTTYKEIIAEF